MIAFPEFLFVVNIRKNLHAFQRFGGTLRIYVEIPYALYIVPKEIYSVRSVI